MRARFTEYAARFVKLATRYEEEALGLETSIGFPTVAYREAPGDEPCLGSGLCFSDEAAGARELAANASRIEAWRRAQSYELWKHVRDPYQDLSSCPDMLGRISTSSGRTAPYRALTSLTSCGNYDMLSACPMARLS